MATHDYLFGPAALYRLYDNDRVLLYVGITANLLSRLAQHASARRDWSRYEGVCYIEVVWFAHWGEAMNAEAEVIETEHPLDNVKPAQRVQMAAVMAAHRAKTALLGPTCASAAS